MRRTRVCRRLVIFAATMSLLGTGTCVSMTQEALIDGFFHAVASSGADWIADEFGVTSGSASGGTTTAD